MGERKALLILHGKQAMNEAVREAVIQRLGQLPESFKAVSYQNAAEPIQPTFRYQRAQPAQKVLLGVDVFLHESQFSPEQLASRLLNLTDGVLHLQMITNRGVKVWPQGYPETFCTDHWRCRFMAQTPEQPVSQRDLIKLLSVLTELGLDVIKIENLFSFNGERGFALGQGQ